MKRQCKICGGTGHDARNCPQKYASVPNDKVVWYRVSNLNDEQADKMTNAVIKAKRKIAPDADAVYVKGDKKSLPERIKEAFRLKSGE